MLGPNLERSLTGVVLSLLIAGLLLLGTAPASAQSKSNGQGIPQQLSVLEQQIAAITLRLDTLSGQSAPTPGGGSAKVLRVVDASGAEIGPMVSSSEVARMIGDSWLVLGVWPDGFIDSPPLFLNDRADCQGTDYMLVFPQILKQASVVGAIAYYATGAPKPVLVAAYHRVYAGGTTCQSFAPTEQTVGDVATFDLSVFVPPFTVRYDQ